MSVSTASSAIPVKVGFIPLTDCAPLILASHLGLDRKHGIRLVLTREPSWAAIRDKLLTGDLDAAHALYGMVYGVQMGIGGPIQDMAVLMTLNRNGQAITLSKRLHEARVSDGQTLAKLIHKGERRYTLAHTFPTGTHVFWLYYWLASQGINPLKDLNSIVVPPPQMGAYLRAGFIDGFCAGEPWNELAIAEGTGFTAIATQDIWPDHPEKILASSLAFIRNQPDTARALVMATLEAARFLDSNEGRKEAASILSGPTCLGTPAELIERRLSGDYRNGLGQHWHSDHPIKFYADGLVSYPWLSDGMWFLTQQRRWGLLDHDPDYLAIARQVNQTELYRMAATELGIAVPDDEMRTSTLMDGQMWDGSEPLAYAHSFALHALQN